MVEHHPDDAAPLRFRNNSVTLRLTIERGDTVVVERAEPIGQVTPDGTHDDDAARRLRWLMT